MKRVFAVLMGSAVLAIAANRADAVAFAPEQPGNRGGGFERWDANGDGVIDKAEFRQMRKAMAARLKGEADRPGADRPGRRPGEAKRGGPEGAPLGGPKAGPREGMPPHPGPGLWDRDDEGSGPGMSEGPGPGGKDRGAARRGPGAQRRGKAQDRARGQGGLRGEGHRCPECGCRCGHNQGPERDPARFGRGGPRGPMGPGFGDFGPRRDRGRGPEGFGGPRGPGGRGGPQGPQFGGERGPGACPFCEMMMRAHRGHMNRRGGFGGRDFAMRGPAGRFGWRQFAQRGPRFGQRLFDRFDENDDNFITPDEFPGRPERFGQWDRNDDGRLGKNELKREMKQRMRQGMQRRGGQRGPERRGPAGPDDDDLPGPRGPHAERTRAL